MKKRKRYCSECGRPIHFIRISGIVRPIHDDGRPCLPVNGVQQRLLPFPQLFTAAFECPVKIEPCRCPAAPMVKSVQLRSGVARFDRLEWPWQRHRCDQTVSVDLGLDYLARQLATEHHDWIRLALVAGAKQAWSVSKPFHFVALIECATPEHRHCLKIVCGAETPEALLNRARVVSGTVVALTGNGEVQRLKTLSGFDFDCVDTRASPDELEIPAEWLGGGDAQYTRI